MVQAQFNTILDGDFIRIPAEYRDKFSQSVEIKVILTSNAEKPKTEKRKVTSDDFKAFNIPVVYKFDREEANER